MSEQRRVRQELRQGLHQFAMGMYQSYLGTHGEHEAKALVAEAIKEQLGLFMASDKTFGASVADVINAKLQELNEQMKQCDDYDSQLYISEKIDALTSALEILEG